MNIACNECRQRLGDALDETANPAEQNALTDHLATCPSCRAELELLQAARTELRAFPILSAPADLRSRVRAQLELESAPISTATATAAIAARAPKASAESFAQTKTKITKSAKAAATSKLPTTSSNDNWREPKPSSMQAWHTNFRAFLSNPTTITWASCCVLLLFYFVTLSRPQKPTGEYKDVKRAQTGEPYEKRFYDDSGEMPIYQSPYRDTPSVKPLPKRAESGRMPNLPPSNVPGQAAPAPAKPWEPKSNAKKDTSDSESSAVAPKTKVETQAPQAKPAAPAAKTKSNSDSAFSSNDRSSAQSLPSQAPSASRSRDDSREAAPASAPKAANNYVARNAPDSARGPAGPPSPVTTDRDESARASLTTREITTRLTPPRSAGWAQISVVLSGEARFADGTKSRIIWRGAAQANEPIDLDFAVQSAAEANAKVTLQEVKNGQTQTIAYKNVAIGATR